MEDTLRKLDKLTNEEARMAAARVLKTTHDVDNRLAGVDGRVAGVDDRVAAVNDRVALVDGTVAVAIAGTQSPSISHKEKILSSDVPRGKTSEGNHRTSSNRNR